MSAIDNIQEIRTTGKRKEEAGPLVYKSATPFERQGLEN